MEEEGQHLFDENERTNFIKVISSFKFYRSVSHIFPILKVAQCDICFFCRKSSIKRIDERVCYVSTLPYKQQTMLAKYVSNLNATKECVDANNRVIEKMLSNVVNLFINSKSNIEQDELNYIIQDPDSDKVHITLKQIARDWSDLGADEREQCYKPIIAELMQHFDPTKSQLRVVSETHDFTMVIF